MLPHHYIRYADLYRQLFTYLEQLEDPLRLRTPGAEAKPDTGDADLYIQLFTYLEQLDNPAKTVSNAIMNPWISLDGAPQTLRIDEGKEFHNNVFRNILDSLDVKIEVGWTSTSLIEVGWTTTSLMQWKDYTERYGTFESKKMKL